MPKPSEGVPAQTTVRPTPRVRHPALSTLADARFPGLDLACAVPVVVSAKGPISRTCGETGVPRGGQRKQVRNALSARRRCRRFGSPGQRVHQPDQLAHQAGLADAALAPSYGELLLPWAAGRALRVLRVEVA